MQMVIYNQYLKEVNHRFYTNGQNIKGEHN